MSDKAIICRITVSPIEGAKTLALGKSYGYTTLVGRETKDGELGILFEEGLALSNRFAEINDLIARKDEQGNRCGGYFEEGKCRVKAKKFMGIRSEAFWAPLSYLAYTGYNLDKLKEGDLLEELNGHEICHKYYTKATQNKRNGPSRRELRGQIRTFPKVGDTPQLRHFIDKIPSGAKIIITEKLHGCSHRTGNVVDSLKLKWYEKLANKLGFRIRTEEHTYLNGSRNVILDETKPGFYSVDFRNRVAAKFEGKIPKNYVFYHEVIGYEADNKLIMPSHFTKDLKDKEISKKYGEKIDYTYGVLNGEFDIYVYRISNIGQDGHRLELPWDFVKKMCKECGFKHVPEIISFIYDGQVEPLREVCERLANDHDNGFPNIREGVCVRWECDGEYSIYKLKSWSFKVMEGICKEEDSYEDPEEIV